MNSLYATKVVLWGGPQDGKEFSPLDFIKWGSPPFPDWVNVLVTDYDKVDEVTGALYGIPFTYETYYRAGSMDGNIIYKIGERK